VSDDPNTLMLTIRYVAADDTFAVVDTAQGGLVVEGGFKRSIDAQRFALENTKRLALSGQPSRRNWRGGWRRRRLDYS
jgi:hypothetical protein